MSIAKVKKITTNKIKTVFLASKIVFFIIISFLFYFSLPQKIEQIVFIPKGTTKAILADLNKKGYDLNLFDYYILRVFGYPQSGWIDFGTTYITKADLLNKLLFAKAALKEITLIPGETTYFVLKQLSQDLGLDFKKLYFEYFRQVEIEDGFFVPDTYKIPLKIDEKSLISLLKKRSLKFHKNLSQEIYGEEYEEKKWLRLLTIASIIQKESASLEEMPLVASVIYNRLAKNMRLQMDGTLNHGRFSHTKITPQMIKEDTSPYNTYKKTGIPPNPVCLVSRSAILAAFNPADTDFLYFVRTAKGKHTFSKTFLDHRKNFDTFKN